MNYGRNNLMVIAAHRYCLGRRTYIVSDCVDWLLGIWSDLDDQTKAIIQRDTEEAFRRDDEDRDGCRENMALGHDCDRREWEKLRDLWMGAKQAEIPEWVDVDDYEEQKQEPVAEVVVRPLRGDQSLPTTDVKWLQRPKTGKLYAAPVRTKDLTYGEIQTWIDALPYDPQDLTEDHLIRFARAVIAADREKNK